MFDEFVPLADRGFYFSGDLPRPLVIKVWHLRTLDAYLRDEKARKRTFEREGGGQVVGGPAFQVLEAEGHPRLSAMRLFRRFAECFRTNVFLLATGEAEKVTPFRRKKGVLWEYPEIGKLPHVALEVPCEDTLSRLAVVVDLSEAACDKAFEMALNWGRALTVIGPIDLAALRALADAWVSRKRKDFISFNFAAISDSLLRDPRLAVLRYFPPDNGRPEEIAITGAQSLTDGAVGECMKAIESAQGQIRE